MAAQKRVEILVVGNELLNGTTLDTNSFWLSKKLTAMGFKVERKTTVLDVIPAIVSAFKQSISRTPDWIFSIGGLGPTFDDMTLRGLAAAVRRKLVLDQVAVEMLRDSYKRRAAFFNRPAKRITKSSLKMATIPSGATPLKNPVGSAPGVLVDLVDARIISLPGVPSEMQSIFRKEIVPLMKGETDFIKAEEWLIVRGLSESRLSPLLTRILDKLGPWIYIKSHPRGFKNKKSVIKVQLILTVSSRESREGLAKLKEATRLLQNQARKLGAEVSHTKSIG